MNQPLKLNLQSTMKDVDVLMGMLFTQKQDSAFTVFDNLTDAQILATLKNKNIGLNKTSTALVLVVNYDGTLYKKTIVDTTPTSVGIAPDMSTGVSISSGYVTTYAGWLYVRSTGTEDYSSFVSVDGAIMYYRDIGVTSVTGSIFMVAKGATIVLGGPGTFNESIYYACIGE